MQIWKSFFFCGFFCGFFFLLGKFQILESVYSTGCCVPSCTWQMVFVPGITPRNHVNRCLVLECLLIRKNACFLSFLARLFLMLVSWHFVASQYRKQNPRLTFSITCFLSRVMRQCSTVPRTCASCMWQTPCTKFPKRPLNRCSESVIDRQTTVLMAPRNLFCTLPLAILRPAVCLYPLVDICVCVFYSCFHSYLGTLSWLCLLFIYLSSHLHIRKSFRFFVFICSYHPDHKNYFCCNGFPYMCVYVCVKLQTHIFRNIKPIPIL